MHTRSAIRIVASADCPKCGEGVRHEWRTHGVLAGDPRTLCNHDAASLLLSRVIILKQQQKHSNEEDKKLSKHVGEYNPRALSDRDPNTLPTI